MGFLINAKRGCADPAEVEVCDWPVPCSVTDVSAFLGFCNYHCKFIRHYTAIAGPLVELTCARATFQWGDCQRKSSNDLCNMLIDGPLLQHPDPNLLCEFILETDASLTGLWVSRHKLLTYKNMSWHMLVGHLVRPIALRTEKHLRHYLRGRHFNLRTDHTPLYWCGSRTTRTLTAC